MTEESGDIPTLIPSTAPNSQDAYTDSSAISSTVPLSIITGFLGAGKSTLVRRILTERHGYRIAVIMNEFGDTADIEAKTINVSSPDDPTAEKSEEILELANGCLCCSIKDSGVAAIEKLMQRKGAFDHILLETTGLADPGPIASMFWQNEEYAIGLGRDIHLDGVICVADAVFGREQMKEDHGTHGDGESLRQIAASDVIILNKVDLVPSAEVEAVRSLIEQINPLAPVYPAVRGQIDLKCIIGIDAYSSRIPDDHFIRATTAADHGGSCEPECSEHVHQPILHHYEIRGISSLQVVCPTLTSDRLQRLDEWIRFVLWERRLPEEQSENASDITVLRCKGMFLTDSGVVYVLQGVREMYELDPVDISDANVGLPDVGKIVLIGKGLSETVRKSLEVLLDVDSP